MRALVAPPRSAAGPAGLSRRVAARGIDLLLVVALPGLVLGAGVVAVDAVGLPRLLVLAPAVLLLPAWLLLGWPLAERAALAGWGRTPGKALLGIEVRSARGGPVAPSEASVRAVTATLPVFLLPGLAAVAGLGRASLALPVLWGAGLLLDALRSPGRRTFPDRAAGTVVVRSRAEARSPVARRGGAAHRRVLPV